MKARIHPNLAACWLLLRNVSSQGIRRDLLPEVDRGEYPMFGTISGANGVRPRWNLTDAEMQSQISSNEFARAVPWNSLTPGQKKFQAAQMAIHAAMIYRMDLETVMPRCAWAIGNW